MQQKEASMLGDSLEDSVSGLFFSRSYFTLHRAWNTITGQERGGQEPSSSVLYSYQPTLCPLGFYSAVLLGFP